MAKKKAKVGGKYDYKKLAKAKSLTENELNALLRYLNNKDVDGEVYNLFRKNKLIDDYTGIKLSKEQSNKGFKWLYNLGFTPKGAERKNSPFGNREEYIVKNPKEIRLIGVYNTAKWQFGSYFVPMYKAIGKDGTNMEYYMSLGDIAIIG